MAISMPQHRFRAMGAQILTTFALDDPQTDRGLNDVLTWLVQWENQNGGTLDANMRTWVMQEAMQRLSVYGPVLVEIDGGVMASGPRPDGTPWPVGVVDPFQTHRHLDMLLLHSGAVYTAHRERKSTLGNPTAPVRHTDVVSATVLAPTLLQAQDSARALLSLDSQAGIDWLEQQRSKGYAGIIVLEDGTAMRSAAWVANCLAKQL
jgi:thiamine biosynthesis lipoprotein ApbE